MLLPSSGKMHCVSGYAGDNRGAKEQSRSGMRNDGQHHPVKRRLACSRLSLRSGRLVRMANLLEHGARKYAGGSILRSSASCQWFDVAAEQRKLPATIIESIDLRQMEVCIATHPQRTRVIRKAGGQVEDVVSEPGMIWLCPIGVHEDEVIVHSQMELLHLYLPATRFDQFTELCGGRAASASAVRYLGGVRDDLIREIGVAFLAEMQRETSAGRVLIDGLALALTARLMQAYSTEAVTTEAVTARHALGPARLRRVLEFIHSHLEEDIGVEDLANVACLSPYHFARMFRKSLGVPPHRYISERRIQEAKLLLATTDASLTEIALTSCFSSQANFNRAFRVATGQSPGEYRRKAR
jgi:AraC family transcriptional regulator